MPSKTNRQTKTAKTSTANQNGDEPKTAYFLSLELENVRCFGEPQTINFSDGNDKPKQWTIILGDNGTGKTTILRTVVSLTPLPTKNISHKENSATTSKDNSFHSNSFSPLYSSLSGVFGWKLIGKVKKQINHLPEEQGVSGIFTLAEGIKSIGKTYILGFTHIFSDFLISGTVETANLIKSNHFAYGASRKAGEISISESNDVIRYKTLFDETALLLNPEEWLIRANYESLLESEFQAKRKEKLNKIIEILKTILPDISDVRFDIKEQEGKSSQPIVEFKTPYGWVEAKDLSLGYRTSMAWMVDFAARMFDLYPDSENPLKEPAVVLIDEIDLHLHPKWQRDLLDWLSDLCPNTQFIVTTHSPLIVQAAIAKDANIVVCKREGDHVVIDQSIEAVKGWRADQILTSDFFDLPKRDKKTEENLERRKELLLKSRLTKVEKTELAELNAKIESLPVNENSEDDRAMDIIRKAAKYIKENGVTS